MIMSLMWIIIFQQTGELKKNGLIPKSMQPIFSKPGLKKYNNNAPFNGIYKKKKRQKSYFSKLSNGNFEVGNYSN